MVNCLKHGRDHRCKCGLFYLFCSKVGHTNYQITFVISNFDNHKRFEIRTWLNKRYYTKWK